MVEITNQMAAIVSAECPEIIGWINVFSVGDIWVKTQGCEACAPERRARCCNNCGMFSHEKGCAWHLEPNMKTSNKPYNCMMKPYPNSTMSDCALEYECIKGMHVGQTRRVKDPGDMPSQR